MMYSRRNSSLLLFAAVCAVYLFSAATAQTSTVMGYQSWASKTPLQTSVGTNTAVAQTVVTVANAGNLTAAEQPSATASAVKFMYNLAWGPPNYYIYSTTGGPANADLELSRTIPSFSAGTIEWTATIGSSAANGFPFGCCGGVGAVTVAELGCRNCISGINTALPNLYTSNWDIAQNQQVVCSGQRTTNGPNSAPCTNTAIVPGVAQGTAGGTLTDSITTGSGVTTLAFPSQSTSVLAAGVYTFQLWAESICGIAKSASVQLAARCPPSPTVSAFLRAVPSNSGDPSNVLTADTNGVYSVPVGSTALVDASASFPYQINKPNWPTYQTGASSTSNFNPTRNLYAIQRIYFSVADATATSVSVANVVATGAYSTSTPILDQWATVATFKISGAHTIVITVTDGCSAGQAIIKVNAICSCTPVAKAMYVPTIWSNQIINAGIAPTTNQMQNLALQNGVLNAGTSVTDTAGVPYNLFTYTLTAVALDYEVAASNLAYDWNFVYWVPDYSNVFTTSYQASKTLAQTYLAVGTGTLWPPTQGSLCSPTGVVPLACQQGWFGLTADPTGTSQRCCFSAQTDLINNVGAVTRPAKGSYLYKVLQVVTNPAQTLRQYTTGTRTKMYNFMRISSGCTPGATAGTNWVSTVTSTVGTSAAAVYYALPLYLQYTTTATSGQMSSTQAYADFNGFPDVNTATPGSGAGPFRPTTECGAWLKTVQTPVNYVEVQTKVNTTVSCGPNTDLVLCRVSITQTGGYTSATATLSVSSFGSCKGQWQFALTVDDSCLNATDYFAVQVGCNRAPVVSAGCTNTQTWSQISGTAQFEQISLDGRASYDPDNFGDSFYGLSSQMDTFPGCLGTTVCQNGGLGTYGLTYAWALISYYNAQSQLVYPTISTNGTITGCPTTTANIGATCVQSYCTGTWNYPIVDPLTRTYGTFVTGTTGTNVFLPSVQGTLTLMQAWQDGFYAVQPVAQGANGYNTMPVLDNGGSTMTAQMIFPDFNAACAPTVYPMFLSVATTTPLPAAGPGVVQSQMYASTADWAYAQQIKHVGNSAYMSGLTQAGMYTARLYAFDGCSVGYADVTFTLECPSIAFQDTSAINWGLAGIYESGNNTVTFAPPDFVITYGGTAEITVSGTVAVYSYVNGAIQTAAGPVRTCSFGQKTVTNPSARNMDVSSQAACQNLLFTRNPSVVVGTWLAPGSYQMVATVTDGCQRGSVVSVNSPIFTVSCQTVTVTAFANTGDNNGIVNINRNLVYTPPAAGGSQGSFPDFTFNITAQSPTSTPNIFNDVTVNWFVYWRPAGTSNPTATADGGASGVTTSFFTNGLPSSGVYSVYQGGSNNVQGGAGTNVASGNIANAKIPGGQRIIQFTQTGTITLSARTDVAVGLNYNTATNAGQANFWPASRGNFGIFWAGDYYVRVIAAAYINGGSATCSTTTGNTADQLFKVTCPAAVDPTSLVTAASQQWANGGTNLFTGATSIYYGSAPFETSAFRTVTLTTPNTPAGVYGNGAASSVSYRITYRAPFGIAPNATDTAANSNQVTFMVFHQNPLLLSPFASLGLANPVTAATVASNANAASQAVSLEIPGTWTLNTFNTNGCANVTSTSSIDLSAYCYDPQMPEANLVYKVYARVPPLGNSACPGGVSNDAAGNAQCDVTNNDVTYCSNVAIVRGPLARPVGTNYARRLLSDDAAATSGRRLLQTSSATTGACAFNANFLAAGSLGSSISFTNPNPAIGGATLSSSVYQFGTTPVLSPNFGAQINIFFNSFDISPTYTPSTTDLRNFYGMGDLFGDNKLQFDTNTVSPLPATSYQGAFEGLTITIDSAQSKIRIPQNANSNNQNVNWLALKTWAGTYAYGSNNGAAVVPPFSSTTPPTTPTFPTGYSTQCSWAAVGTLNVASSSNTFNGYTDLPMYLQGCSPLGTAASPLATGIATGASANVAGVTGTGSSSSLVVSHRAIEGTTAATNLFSMQASSGGRITSYAGNYDYQVISWNGPVGKSCYDYRAVRVVAVCNRLVAYDFTTGATGNPSYRATTTEGPVLVSALVSNPSTIQKNTPSTTTANIAQPVAWMNGMFDGVNVTAGFKYLQCGSAAVAGLGGADPTTVTCGSVPGSRDGEGNYYSLQFSWAVVSAPTNSIFNVATSNDTITNYVLGAINVNSTSTVTDPTDSTRTITTTQYIRTNTWTQTQTQRWVRLLNHGYHYPMTTLRPDVEGTYQLQLTIADGCSTWQSAVLSVTATCTNLATTLGAFNTFVTLRQSTSPTTAIATANALPATLAGATSIPSGAVLYNVPIDGSQYVRLTLSAAPATQSGYYYTYKWAVTPVFPTNYPAVPVTNFQGSVASFVPTDQNNNVAYYDNMLFRVDLTVFTNCMTSTGPQQATVTAYIAVTCSLNVADTNFIFYTPYVNTYNANPQTTFGFPTTGTLSTFANNFNGNYNLYYRNNYALKTAGGAISNTGSMLTCDATGPYCAPNPSAPTSTLPTILFAGSVPQGSGSNGQPDNTAYYQSPTNAALGYGSVWGAGWQSLYFSVPVSLTPNICKIKNTYWVLTGYQNALPFVPSYVPISTPAAPTCTPKQDWSWTVIATPCQTCNCGGTSTTCSEMDMDVCDFTPNYQYQYRTINYPAPSTTQGSIGKVYTGYNAPIFTQIGTASAGTSLNAYCVYDSGNRLDGLPNIANLRANCRSSGRGLAVDIAQSSSVCASTGPNGAVSTTTASTVCPMSNIAFVPSFPGAYTLQLSVYDYCGSPVLQTVTVNAQCRLKPQVSVLQQSITSFYDCQDPNALNYGNPNAPATTPPVQGRFDPITMSTLIAASGITAVNDTTPVAPSIRSAACAVTVPKSTWNCTDVKNYVDSQNVAVDTSTTSSKFRSCCQCLYGSQTINVFGSNTVTPSSGPTPAPTPANIPGSTTQHNILALDDAEYNRNSIILIALVTPMAVILVGSLAGNVLMALKMRQGATSAGGFNVRAGDVELSTSPRARVDV